jgi:uncharacterized protein YqhQ
VANKEKRTTIGGQALIEGIMMRGPEAQAIAVRDQSGQIVLTTEKLKFVKDKYPILGLPLIRGVVNFGGSMVAGVKALMYSASFYPEDEENAEPSKFEQWLEKHIGSEKLESLIIYVALLLGIGLSVGLFFLLPTFLVGLVKPLHDSYILRNLCEGIVKIAVFTGYMIAVSRMQDMRRVFSYHGAEHKTIKCYELGQPLTVENVRPCTRKHPRCGTSFLFVVIFISILLGSFIHVGNTALRMLCHLAMLFPVVAISYECNRLVGRYDNALTKILTAPGLWFQNFTTNEPDDSMIECAIAALEAVIPEQEGADNW